MDCDKKPLIKRKPELLQDGCLSLIVSYVLFSRAWPRTVNVAAPLRVGYRFRQHRHTWKRKCLWKIYPAKQRMVEYETSLPEECGS